MSSVSALNSLLSSSTSSSSSTASIDLSSLLSAATGATSTGIDVTAAVNAAVYAAQAPERQWQAQQTTVKAQITALTSIQSSLASLSSDLDSLNNLNGPLAARAVTSSTSAVSATATAGASVGSHSVAVSSLATTASWYSAALPSDSSPLGSSQLQIVSADGTTTSFSTGSGVNTLSQLASAINAAGLSVTASIVTDSVGSRLAVVGSTSGSAADFKVSYGSVAGSSWTSASVAGASTGLAAGSFSIGDGSSTATINVAAGDTLGQVANRINNQGLNLTASVVSDSSGAHLSLSPTGSGSLTVSGDPALSLTRATQASNASLTVDGVPISSSSNTVTGAVNGLTLTLSGTTGGQQTIAVTADSNQIQNAVGQLVTDYNSALSLVNSQFTYSASSGSQGALSGDSSIRSLQSLLGQIVSYTAGNSGSSGSSSSGSINTLASLGVTMGDDGSLSLDSNVLQQDITNNASGVQNFFQGASLNGFAQSFQTQLNTFSNAATGAITVGIQNLNQTYTSLQSQVDDYESGYIASQKTVLTAMYSQAEVALQSLPATLKQLQAQLNPNSGS